MSLKPKLASLCALVLSTLALSSEAKAEQPYYDSTSPKIEFNQWDAAVLGLNVAIGCSFGVIPSLWRGDSASKTLEQCAKGSLGGTFVYAGEKAASYTTTPGIGWAAHGLVAVGSSVRENTAQNYDMFERIAFDIAFMHLSIGSEKSNHNSTVQAYALPGPFLGIWTNLAQGNKFNWKASLYNGNPIFEAHTEQFLNPRDEEEGSSGIANVATVRVKGTEIIPGDQAYRSRVYHYYNRSQDQAIDFSHEQIHAVMYREFGSTDVLLEQWRSYDWFKQRSHLSLGGDLSYAAIVGISAPFPHNQKPSEWNALNLDHF